MEMIFVHGVLKLKGIHMFKNLFLSLLLVLSTPVLAEEPIEEIVVIGEEKSLWDFSHLNKYEKEYFNYRPLRFSTRTYYWGGAIGNFYQATQSTYLGLEFRQQYYTFREPFYFDKYSRTTVIEKREFVAISINFYF